MFDDIRDTLSYKRRRSLRLERIFFAKMKTIPKDKQDSVVSQLRAGYSVRKVAKRLSISPATVSRIRTKCLPTLIKQPVGRPRILSARDKNDLKRKLLSGLLQTGTKVHKHLRDEGTDISYRTVLRNLREIGFQAKKKMKKPFLSLKHRKARLEWAKAHQYWTVDDWKRVVFSDETKINLWNSDGIQYCWTRPGDPVQPFHLQPTVKHGGGSLMFWGCMMWQGLGYGCQITEGTMKKDDYINILDSTLKESLEYYGYGRDDYIFQHDNDPKHTAKATTAYLRDQGIEALPWPAQSADLNPIEHVWDILKVQIGRRARRPTSIHELWVVVQEEWDLISPEIVQRLYESMPRRVQAVLRARGGNTKY